MAAGRHETAFIVGAVIGSVAGAVYGLLNAPQAGWRTRADLSDYAEELGDRLAARVGAVTSDVRALLGDEGELEEGSQWDAALITAVDETVLSQDDAAMTEPPTTIVSEGVVRP